MKKFRGIGVLVAFLAMASLAFGQAATEKKTAPGPGDKAQVVNDTAKTRGAGAVNPNIKSADTKNNSKQQTPPPPNKGGATRGAGPYECGIHVDNHTPWRIEIYVDGNYAGTVNSWGDVAGITGNGPSTLYGIARFSSDLPDLEWGPTVFNCPAGSVYTWRLNRP